MSDVQTRGPTEGLSYVAVYHRLREEILTCSLPPGAPIYEQDLAKRFEVSKSPIRDALLRLKEQNLVEVQPRRGYRVRPISITEAAEMYEMRLLYEQACLLRAIDHADAATIADLRALCDGPAEADIPTWTAHNKRFHIGLAQASGNSRLGQVASELIDHFDRFTYVSAERLSRPLNFSRLIAEHRAMVEAIASKDRRAGQKLIRTHIEASRKRTMQSLQEMRVVS